MPDSTTYSYYYTQYKVYIIAINSICYTKYIKVGSVIKYNIYSPSFIEQAKFIYTKKQLADNLKEAYKVQ